MRHGRESWILAALLLIFVAATAHYAERGFESRQSLQPTTYSVGSGGLRALYELYRREGLRVRRSERPFTQLPPEAGMLVMVEPLERGLQPDEAEALWRWVDNGGSLLLVVAGNWPLRRAMGLTVEGVEITGGPPAGGDIPPAPGSAAYLRDVRRLRVTGTTRLINRDAEHQATLASDAYGAFAIAWDFEGGGSVVVVTDGLAADNTRLAEADNAVFFVNAAQRLARKRPLVLFDEFHQGFGEASGGRSLWQALGTPARAVFWYGLIVLLLVVYNANRRFGAAKRLTPLASRPSTEYIASMAGLFRRAGAAGIALETIYRSFAHDLAARLDAPPDAPPERVAELGARRFGWDAVALRALLDRCERIARGDIVTEAEMLRLAAQIQEYRRQADLVRHF